MRSRILGPLVVLVLVFAGAATAAAAGGVFESNNSGLDSPRDLAERGTAVTGATGVTGATSPTISIPDNTLPDDNIGGNGDNRTETETTVVIAPGATQTFAAGDAGSVTIRRDGASLTVLSANANAGFAGEVERGTGAEVEVQFANGTTRVDFNAELEDGAVRVRVRVSGGVADEPTTVPTTVSTLPDNDDNVDNSGPGNAHQAEDNSGPGNAQDAVDDDDDNSGPGSSGSDNSVDSGADDHSGSGSGSDDSGSGHSGSGGSGSGSNSGSGGSGSGH